MNTYTEAHPRQANEPPAATEEPNPAFKESDAPLAGNPILMRAASRTRRRVSSGPVVWVAGALILAIAIAASYWVIHTSQRPLLASAGAPVAPTVPTAVPTPRALTSTIPHHRKRASVLARNERGAAVRRESLKAPAAVQAGSDANAIVTLAPIPPVAPSASSPRVAPTASPRASQTPVAIAPPAAGPLTPALVPPPEATGAPDGR